MTDQQKLDAEIARPVKPPPRNNRQGTTRRSRPQPRAQRFSGKIDHLRKRHDGNASMLANHPEVQARLEEIRAVPVGTRAIAARNKVTPETLIEWQNEVREQGMKSGQLSAASTAIREISILTDHRIERSEIGSPGEFDHLTDDELERVLVQRMAALGLAVEVLPESDTQH